MRVPDLEALTLLALPKESGLLKRERKMIFHGV